MRFHIEPVTPANRQRVLALRVAPNQQQFIETTAQCLHEADSLSLWRPVGLYDDEELVGFAMYGLFSQEEGGGRVWLDRLLIDHHHQGRHYGEIALCALLERMADEYQRCETYLSLYPANSRALALYEKHGFCTNGERDLNGEHVMVRHAPAHH